MLIGCAEQSVAHPRVGDFTLNQLSGAGCGMTLWQPKRSNNNRFIFFNGLQPNSMEMMIDGKMTKFRRIKATGQQFYGQKTSQTFRSQDGKTVVDVNVKLGAKGEIESVQIKQGTLRVTKNGQQTTIPVVGDAGC